MKYERYLLLEAKARNFHMKWVYGKYQGEWWLCMSWEAGDGWYEHERKVEEFHQKTLDDGETEEIHRLGYSRLREITEAEIVMFRFESCTA